MNATMQATYNVEDNKLRIYAEERLDAETFEKVKAAGFRWAPKQQLFVAPKWTPSREDLCIELAGEIDPEGTTLAERAPLASSPEYITDCRRRAAHMGRGSPAALAAAGVPTACVQIVQEKL